ncbi:MAG: amino acid ABC transporter permease [Clostridia bacterium]|nr:amino acid ABC transporter permease [Clostridia bacterium]
MVQILSMYGPMLLAAMGQTLLLALCGLIFGSVLGIIFGLSSVVDNKISKTIAAIYVHIIRGVPMIVLAFFVFYGVPYGLKTIFGSKFTFTALQAGTVCLAVNCGAYMSEIIRAGIQAIDPGQMEAARSLGLSYWRSMFRVVLPQAIKNMIPSIVNQFIITLKDTSILSVIGFPELVNKAQNVIAITFKSFQTWSIVAVMYLVVILILQQVANMLERRLNRGRK